MEKNLTEELHAKNIKYERAQRKRNAQKSRNSRTYSLIFMVLILIVISIVNMLSASLFDIYEHGFKVVLSHTMYLVVAMIIAGLFAIFGSYKWFDRNRVVGMLFLGSILVFLFVICVGKYLSPIFPICEKIVPRVNGAIGWIRVGGLSIQPSELIKIPYIIILAHAMDVAEKKKYKDGEIAVFLGIIVAVFMGLTVWQEDLGTGLHYLAIFIFMFFMTRFNIKWITGISVCLISLMGGFFWYIYSLEDVSDKGYKLGRIGSFVNGLVKNEYDNRYGYQVWQSLLAFGSGGFKGKGYGNGVQKYSYLPEVNTDFILASFGEEFGFVGMILLLFIYFMIFSIIKRIAMNTKDYFGKYLAIGIGGYLITQVLINVSVALGLLPVFGIPMPLFSYGGSSILTVLMGISIALNINNQGYK